MKHPGIPTVIEELRKLDKPERIAALDRLLGKNPDRMFDPEGFKAALDFNAHLVTELGNARVCIW